MAACVDGDSFRLDSDYSFEGLDSADGCYSDSGETLLGVVVYFRDGNLVAGEPSVRGTEIYGTTVSQGLGNIRT